MPTTKVIGHSFFADVHLKQHHGQGESMLGSLQELASKFATETRTKGVSHSVRHALRFIVFTNYARLRRLDPILRRRSMLSRQIGQKFDYQVAYGPFKGTRLSSKWSWTNTNIGSMLLGLYELEILNVLACTPRSYECFVDIGASDGYYSVGTLVAGMFQRVYCFERSVKGQEIIADVARANGVLDKIEIFSSADKNALLSLSKSIPKSSVVMLDIEGGEFSLLDEDVFDAFSQSIFLIELHDWMIKDGEVLLRRLLDAASKHHSVTKLTTGSRNPSQFLELAFLSDNDRWLVCSEGRRRLMTWLYLVPRQALNSTPTS